MSVKIGTRGTQQVNPNAGQNLAPPQNQPNQVGNHPVNGQQVTWIQTGAYQPNALNVVRQHLPQGTSLGAAEALVRAVGIDLKQQPNAAQGQELQKLAAAFTTAKTKATANSNQTEAHLALKTAVMARLTNTQDKDKAGVAANLLAPFGLKNKDVISKNEIDNVLKCVADFNNSLKTTKLVDSFGQKTYSVIFGGTSAAIQKNWATHQNVIKQFTMDELCALHCYTEDAHCKMINTALRDGVFRTDYSGVHNPADYKGYMVVKDIATTALKRLPDFKGFCWRGTNLPQNKHNDNQKGKIQRDAGFTSTSSNPNEAFDGVHQLKILSETGKNIAFVSLKPHEEEILFGPNTTFDVVQVTVKGNVPFGTDGKTTLSGSNNDNTRGLVDAVWMENTSYSH